MSSEAWEVQYSFMHKSHESSIELFYHGVYAADLDKSILLMSKEGSQVKCTIASLALFNAETLRNISIEDTYIYDAPGMPSFTRRVIREALEKFDKQDIKKYADACSSKNT